MLADRRTMCILFTVAVGAVQTCVASTAPGNVHVENEAVHIIVPDTWGEWRVVDIDGREIAHGQTLEGEIRLGMLPIGYYEVRQMKGTGLITAAVLAKTTASENTPIALDAAMSWFYADPRQLRDASALCRLAGVTWVRDRLSWPEIEIARGTWADETRYEQAMRIQR